MGSRSSQCGGIISSQRWSIWNYDQLYSESTLNFTLKAPESGYTCGVAHEVKLPTRFISLDGSRTTQAHGEQNVCTCRSYIYIASAEQYDEHMAYFCSDMERDMHIFTIF